jgi:hypothetical protein
MWHPVLSRMSAVESKPAGDGRIKTSHFFLFKPVEDVDYNGVWISFIL